MGESKGLNGLRIAANIDRKTFFRFALYDSFVRRRGLINPLLFTLILSGFAAVCFFWLSDREDAVLLGSVLLCVGLVLPLVWFGMFFASVSRQASRYGLSPDRAQYFVTLSPDRIHVEKGKETADFTWSGTHMARRIKGCIYLYVSPARAFLIPDCADSADAWALIVSQLPPEKLQDRLR